MNGILWLLAQAIVWINVLVVASAILLLIWNGIKWFSSEHQNKRDEAKGNCIRILIW